MSYLSPVAPVPPTAALAASVPPDNLPTLAWWNLLIGIRLKMARDALAAKLGAVDRGEIDSPRGRFEAALAECDAIEASTAALVVPYQAKHDSILGHLVAELEAAVAHAEHEARIASLQAHKARLDDLMNMDTVAGSGE